jgi:CheY-like chemotaxis protein
MYADELAKQSFTRALRYDSACADANSGLARAIAGQVAAAEALTLGGADAASLAPFVEQGSITLNLSGPAALDAALSRAVAQNDPGSAIVLIRTLGRNAQQPTAGMMAALKSNDGAIRSEAAVACGRMSAEGKGKCPAEVITQLGDIAGREIARVALVIDADAARSAAVAKALQAAGIMPTVANNGAMGMSLLRRLPGVDAVLLADKLPDVTSAQVLEEVRSDPATAKTPVLLLSGAENAAAPYGERIQGVIAKPDDVTAVTGALDKSLGTERARADALSVQAAGVLASLAGSNDVKAAVPGLSHTIASRPDGVTVPAANVLAIAGGPEQVDALVAVVADGNRSEAARAACAHAVASIIGRGATPSAEAIKALHDAAHSTAPLSVREAAAAALGNLNLSHEDRAAHLAASQHAAAQG